MIRSGSFLDDIPKPVSPNSQWNFDTIQMYDTVIQRQADKYGLDYYPNQIEVINTEQMCDAYSSIGLPVMYHHWSHGMSFIENMKQYHAGKMGLAYEIVINSDPCIAYLMEDNTSLMQALVIAHACYGHNSFFKGNYLFKQWTDASFIVDYLVFAKDFILDCEKKYGIDKVTETLDDCHAFKHWAVDKYKRPQALNKTEEMQRQKERSEYLQSQVNLLWSKTIPESEKVIEEKESVFPSEPEDNILYFIEKHAPNLEPWQREIVRIVRRINQYFFPQSQTQVMNEGWATFWHYTLIDDIRQQGYITDGQYQEFLASHTNVVYQPAYNSPYYSGINPYALGFDMYTELQRICLADPNDRLNDTKQLEEDKRWFPDLVGQDWNSVIHDAMRNFKDESFISQFLSPRLMRKFGLFSIENDELENELLVTEVSDDEGYDNLREQFSSQYRRDNMIPDINIVKVDVRGDRSIVLRHIMRDGQRLDKEYTEETLKHFYRLWQFPVILESVDPNKDGVIETFKLGQGTSYKEGSV